MTGEHSGIGGNFATTTVSVPDETDPTQEREAELEFEPQDQRHLADVVRTFDGRSESVFPDFMDGLSRVGTYDPDVIGTETVTAVRADGTAESGLRSEDAILIGQMPFDSNAGSLDEATYGYLAGKLRGVMIPKIQLPQEMEADMPEQLRSPDLEEPDKKAIVRAVWAEQSEALAGLFAKVEDAKAELRESHKQRSYNEPGNEQLDEVHATEMAKLYEASLNDVRSLIGDTQTGIADLSDKYQVS